MVSIAVTVRGEGRWVLIDRWRGVFVHRRLVDEAKG
jgi:hypothetical protein